MSVLVFADHTSGTFKKKALESINYAAETAKKVGGDVVVLTLGNISNDELTALGQYGAQKVLNVNNEKLNKLSAKAYAKAIVAAAKKVDAKVIVTSHNVTGKTVSGMVAAILNAGLVAGAIDYPQTENGFVVKKNVFSGKAFANVKINSDIKVITLTPNTFAVKTAGGGATVEDFSVDFSNDDFGVQQESEEKITGTTPLGEAELVVSGGRGLKGQKTGVS